MAHVSTNGCNQRSVYNWLSDFDAFNPPNKHVVELSFKNGRKILVQIAINCLTSG